MIDVSSSGRSARCRWRIAVPAGPDEETGNRKFVMISVVAIILGYWGWRIIGSEDEDLAVIRSDAETARAKQDAGIRHDFEADAVRISELHKSLQEERARADQLKRDVATARLHEVGQSHQKLVLAISRHQERERADSASAIRMKTVAILAR